MFELHVVVRDTKPTMDRVSFRARIISLLRVPTLGNPHSPYNMHMVLLDPFGEEIQASVYGPSVPFFSRNLHEGYVYDFASFQVVEAEGEFRLSNHVYNLIFLFFTSLERAPSLNFPVWTLKTNSVDAMFASDQLNTHLQDFFGMLTAVSNEGYHVIRGRRTLVRGIELCNEYGTFDCVLLGNYVHDFRVGIASAFNGQNVVLLKLVKGQVCRGRVVCSTVFFVSTVLLNPNIPEVIHFRGLMLLAGFVRSPPIVTYFSSRGSIENQLMGDFPPVTLVVLKSINKIFPQQLLVDYAVPQYLMLFLGLEYHWFVMMLLLLLLYLLLLDRDARVLLKRSCSDFFPLSSEHPDVLVEVSDLLPESKDLKLFVTRVGQGIINLKSNEPKANPVTPALNKSFPPFPTMENVHGNDTPGQRTEAKDDDNANICVGKGKSAFHPYHPNLKRRQLKKNLINEYDTIFPGESSTTTNFYQPNMTATTEDLSNSYATTTISLSK
ncbi:hypothetical protein RIF29_34865 [Crotalaria pallida]|uniref:Replication protein A 70 kDa DNA-binding subunit B/D first OB fold domain-containing protein n=1 Tax=Crotalaria pallida TaxID=3830 RepID=A0AAN9E9S7_CROPI